MISNSTVILKVTSYLEKRHENTRKIFSISVDNVSKTFNYNNILSNYQNIVNVSLHIIIKMIIYQNKILKP